ncbi:MAG: hypothetical protein ACW98K_07565 [Candidatus Kariarchaeaceae archaeon]|jgi:hypothetical protein
MANRSQLEGLSIEELYDWVTNRYNQYSEGEISEEEYLADLDYYKSQLAQSEEEVAEVSGTTKTSYEEKPGSTRVRSTSIAGLRKKLMDELQE